MATKASSTDKPTPDWERIELDYRAGIKSLREIAEGTGVSHVTISKHAKKHGWVRDLSAKIAAKAEDLVNRASVNSPVNTASAVSEREMVDGVAQERAAVQLSHRKDSARAKDIAVGLLHELEDGAQIYELPDRVKMVKTLADTLRVAIDIERQAFGMDTKGADTAPGAAGYVPPSVQVHFVRAPQVEVDDD